MSIKDALLNHFNISEQISGSNGSSFYQGSKTISSFSPIENDLITNAAVISGDQLSEILEESSKAFLIWRNMPAPQRGEIIRQYGNALRNHKQQLGELVTIECGKSIQEGLGEVQEMIDICDFAAGLSRQLSGSVFPSERPNHKLQEQYHPLGVVGIISAFNFPVAVWSWNVALAAICGNCTVWKPSEKTPITAIACFKILQMVLKTNDVPDYVFNLVIGGKDIGRQLVEDKRVTLISATGSTEMGRKVNELAAKRFAKTLLELGGNNALILSEYADVDYALKSVVFGAVGTCGQRCTSTRRLIVHEAIIEEVKRKLIDIYSTLKIGNPLNEENLVGPLIDEDAVANFFNAINEANKQGGEVLFGGTSIENLPKNYVLPALILAHNEMDIVQCETFGPILYIIPYNGNVNNAISIQNNVPQGLSSSLFTENMQEAEVYLSASGSDCGIANVNSGTSGAEIGGAFGGEKESGSGRESGSDAWKYYMRRQTNTINYGKGFALSQGIKFNN